MISTRYIVGQLGSRMRYAVPRQLHEANRLERLFTDVAAVGAVSSLRAIPPALRPAGLRRLLGRVPAGIPRRLIAANPWLGVQGVRNIGSARSEADLYDVFLRLGKRFAERVAAEPWGAAEGLYMFNSAALESLIRAKSTGVSSAVEQTSQPFAFERARIVEETDLWPGWMATASSDSAVFGDVEARERAEWEVADLVVCGSAFVRQAVGRVGGPMEKCVVVPYGVALGPFESPSRMGRSGPLRVLTAGNVGLRKGAPYVAEAARRLGSAAVFRWIGGTELTEWGQRQVYDAGVDLAGSVPKAEVAAQFAWADVFLLPSLCEGSATVTYEALAAGLPVVCTPNTGSIVRDGIDGFIIPARDGEAAAERLERLFDPDLRAEMSAAAVERSAVGSEQAYGQRLLAALDAARPTAR